MMDDFGLYPREEPFDPLSVVLFKALQVIAFLFFIALLAISPDAKDGKIDSKAEFIITMDWPDNHPDDIDFFGEDPTRTAISSGRIRPATSRGIAIGRPVFSPSIATTAAALMISSSSTARKFRRR